MNKILKLLYLKRTLCSDGSHIFEFCPSAKVDRFLNKLKNKLNDIVFWWYGIRVYHRPKDLSDKNANVKFRFTGNK